MPRPEEALKRIAEEILDVPDLDARNEEIVAGWLKQARGHDGPCGMLMPITLTHNGLQCMVPRGDEKRAALLLLKVALQACIETGQMDLFSEHVQQIALLKSAMDSIKHGEFGDPNVDPSTN